MCLLKCLLQFRPSQVRVEVDGKPLELRVFSLNVGICKYSGGGMMFAPQAIPDDGLFDITVIGEMGTPEVLMNIRRLYNGSILSHRKVRSLRGKSVRIRSEPEIALEIDGESAGMSPFEFEIIPRAVGVLSRLETIN